MGSLATGSSQQKVRPCPLRAESRSKLTALAASATGLCRLMVRHDVIQALKLEPRIMRYELSAYEWRHQTDAPPLTTARRG
jgi:hypothetical protein